MDAEKKHETAINVYSDESRHLKNQSQNLVIGGIWCESATTRSLTDKVALIKRQFDIAPRREIKWTKVSPAKLDYYKALIDMFFAEDGVYFRAIVVPTGNLQHELFNQTEDEFYYKMQYAMITNIIRKRVGDFKIFLDYKDTWSNFRSQKLASFLGNKIDFHDRSFTAQPIRSSESTPMQLADLLIGAVAYAANETRPKGPKAELVQKIESLSGQKLNQQSPFGVDKFNIFIWHPQEH